MDPLSDVLSLLKPRSYVSGGFEVGTIVASGSEYIRLGTEMQLKLTRAKDMRTVVEGRGAKFVVADLGRYGMDPQYKAQMPKVIDGVKQAVTWYEEGKVKPIITEIVPFDTAALQQAFDAFMKDINNVGKMVVKCNRNSV